MAGQPSTMRWQKRDSTSSHGGIIFTVSLVIIVSLGFIAYLSLRQLRKRHSNPRYIPTSYLQRRWRAWQPRGTGLPKETYGARSHDNASAPTLHLRSARTSTYILSDAETAAAQPEAHDSAGVGRHPSVRSVATLPAYSRSVRANERVLGREGERDGIDVVVEQPETQEEEEARRDEEMEGLYQIRAQRRREIAQREQRSRERSAARARGDVVGLERLRRESARFERSRESSAGAAAALALEHRERSQDRRISSVSYGDVGLARHDGTRIRADSNDSERPLLTSAASMGSRLSVSASGALQPWQTSSSLSLHSRDLSTGSPRAASEHEGGGEGSSSELDVPPFGHAGSDFEIVTLGVAPSRTSSRPQSPYVQTSRSSSNTRPARPPIETGVDLSDERLPANSPPSYGLDPPEDAPPYTSPVRDRGDPRPARVAQARTPSGAPLLPELGRFASIRIPDVTPEGLRDAER